MELSRETVEGLFYFIGRHEGPHGDRAYAGLRADLDREQEPKPKGGDDHARTAHGQPHGSNVTSAASSAPGAADPPAPEGKCPPMVRGWEAICARLDHIAVVSGRSQSERVGAAQDAEDIRALAAERDKLWERVAKLETALAAAEKRADAAEEKARRCFRLPLFHTEADISRLIASLRRIAEMPQVKNPASESGRSLQSHQLLAIADAIERGAEAEGDKLRGCFRLTGIEPDRAAFLLGRAAIDSADALLHVNAAEFTALKESIERGPAGGEGIWVSAEDIARMKNANPGWITYGIPADALEPKKGEGDA